MDGVLGTAGWPGDPIQVISYIYIHIHILYFVQYVTYTYSLYDVYMSNIYMYIYRGICFNIMQS